MSLYAHEQSKHPLPLPDESDVSSMSSRWPWIWMILACGLMGVSGFVRIWQDHRFTSYQKVAVTPTFPLRDLPEQLGSWKARAGSEEALDPQIARLAGSTDSLVRSYVNTETGVALDLLVIYGRTEVVSGHTPEACYPAAGYQAVDAGMVAPVPWERPNPAEFRSMVFARRNNPLDRQEVFYGFRQLGRWSPDVESNWKALNADPSVFKVQVQRRVGALERRYLANPTQMFLAVLLPELERRIALAASAPFPRAPNESGTRP